MNSRKLKAYLPGSKYIYLKLYTGNKTAEFLLNTKVYSMTNFLLNNGLIKKWFFIRYADPYFHLRIRLLVTDEKKIGEILSYISKNLNQYVVSRMIWKIDVSTYFPEIKRFGDKYELAETMFFEDSKCILSIARLLYKTEKYNPNLRWMICLKLIDSLLDDFRLSLRDKIYITEIYKQEFKQEFGFNEFNSKSLNLKYRDNRYLVESSLDAPLNDDIFEKLTYPIKTKSQNIKNIIGEIMQRNNRMSTISLIGSYIHLSINRLFESNGRMHELVLYDFLSRYYEGKAARNLYKNHN